MANISHFTQTVNGVSTTYDIHDANAVDLTSNQTVGGIKTFSNAPVVNSISLDGKTIDTDANGNMIFNGNKVDTIEEQGNDYIRYSNGIQICWGLGQFDDGQFISYPKAFTINPSVVASKTAYAGDWSTVGFTMVVFDGHDYACWLAIGYWK